MAHRLNSLIYLKFPATSTEQKVGLEKRWKKTSTMPNITIVIAPRVRTLDSL